MVSTITDDARPGDARAGDVRPGDARPGDVRPGDAGSGVGAGTGPGRLLCLIGCAAPPVLQIAEIVDAARAEGWDTGLVLTPTAAGWLAEAVPGLARRTGHPVRTAYTRPGEVAPFPRADAVLVAPATANSLNKCAAGISDTLALGLMNDALGRNVPIVAVACVTHDLAHPALPASVAVLRGAGMQVLGVDGPASSPFPWRDGLDRIGQVWARRSSPGPPPSRVQVP